MRLNENVHFSTLVAVAIREGEAAIGALEGRYEPRAEDYVEVPRPCSTNAFTDDYHDIEFGTSRERAAYRRSSTTVAGAFEVERTDEVDEERQLVEDSRPYIADFNRRLDRLAQNLKVNSYRLHEDFKVARRQYMEPDANRGAVLSERERVQLMLEYLGELSSQEGVDDRLRMFGSSDSVGVSVYGMPYRAGKKKLSDQILADSAAFDKANGWN